MAQLIHIIDPKTDKPNTDLKEWVVIDLQMLSEEEILETYCRHFGAEMEISAIVEIPDDVGMFPTHLMLSAYP